MIIQLTTFVFTLHFGSRYRSVASVHSTLLQVGPDQAYAAVDSLLEQESSAGILEAKQFGLRTFACSAFRGNYVHFSFWKLRDTAD